MFYQGYGHIYVHFPHPFIHYIKGNDDGTASCVWNIELHTASGKYPSTIDCNVLQKTHHMSHVKYLQNTQLENIHPKLRINPGEIKLIVESCILVSPSISDIYGTNYSIRNQLGLYIATPETKGTLNNHFSAFTSVVILSPRAGLFSETPPQ
ncbi:MAG: hypothetical protein E7015_03115 [Alphaproteobacteria bacterium]|nr:hypothetical protein [Alphaproteobacteria bacterium]